MNRILLAASMAMLCTTGSYAKNLSGDEIRKTYPGAWNITTGKGAKGKITFKRNGAGGIQVGKFKSPILWTVKGSKICTVFIGSKGLVDSCSTIKKIGNNSYQAQSGSVISK